MRFSKSQLCPIRAPSPYFSQHSRERGAEKVTYARSSIALASAGAGSLCCLRRLPPPALASAIVRSQSFAQNFNNLPVEGSPPREIVGALGTPHSRAAPRADAEFGFPRPDLPFALSASSGALRSFFRSLKKDRGFSDFPLPNDPAFPIFSLSRLDEGNAGRFGRVKRPRARDQDADPPRLAEYRT